MLLSFVLSLSTNAFAWGWSPPEVGDGELFAEIPDTPGYPEAVLVHGLEIFVTGPAAFGTAGTGPSQVHAFSRLTGDYLYSIDIENEDLGQEHALTAIEADIFGRIYVASTQIGVVRLTRGCNGVWEQESYSTPFPDVNPFDPLPPIPNDAVFTPSGDLLVTDNLQATIWRVPAGGGDPEPWFTDPSLGITGSVQFGPNGIRTNPERDRVYFAYTGGPAVAPGELEQNGKIYSLPLIDAPTSTDLSLEHEFDSTSMPDGINFTEDGNLWVVLPGENRIAAINLDTGDEELSIDEVNGAGVPFDQPSNMAWGIGRYAFVVNHALYSGNPDSWVVYKVYTGVRGDNLDRPFIWP